MAIWVGPGGGGGWRLALGMSVGASGAHKSVVGVWVGSGGVWKPQTVPVFHATGVAGLTTGSVGYASGTMGSMSPTAIGSNFVLSWADSTSGLIGGTVRIGGFALDPGRDWASYFRINNTVRKTTNATYSFASGVATWNFLTQPFGFVDGVGFTAEIG
jgi:hypothetical protein